MDFQLARHKGAPNQKGPQAEVEPDLFGIGEDDTVIDSRDLVLGQVPGSTRTLFLVQVLPILRDVSCTSFPAIGVSRTW